MNPRAESSEREAEVRAWIGAGLIVAAVVVVYANSFAGAFQFDDVPAILENPTLRSPADLAGLLAPPGDQAGTVGGRPLLNLSLALNYQLGGTRVWGYHLFNLLVHAGTALLLYGILRRTLRRKTATSRATGIKAGPPWESPWSGPDGGLIAFFSALLWAVHPLQTEAVTYVVQRAESLMGLCYLLTLYGFIRYAEPAAAGGRSHGRWAGLAVLACLLGMATKEVMVSAPLMVLVYDRTFVAGSLREAWRRRRGFYLGLGASWLLLAVLVAGTHGRGGSAGYEAAAAVWPYLLTQCRAILHYLRLAFWPAGQVFDYGTALVRHPGEVLGQGVALALLLGATVYAWRRHAGIGFLALWFFVLLAPSSSFVPISTEPVAEHRMYLSLAAVAILAVSAGLALAVRWSPRHGRMAFCGVGLIAALGLGAATIRRNRDYRSELALWADTVQKVPGNPRAHNNLAEAFRAAGQAAPAMAEFAAAVQVDPDYAPAQYNLGVTLLDSGHAPAAIPHLEKALAAPRHQAELRQYLGEAYARLGQRPAASENFREALRLAPGNVAAAAGLGNNLAVQGDYAGAVAAFRRAVMLAPDQARLRNDLATALAFAGRMEEAKAEFRETLRRDPGNVLARENLEQILKQGEAGPRP